MAGRMSDFSDGGRFEPRPPLWTHLLLGFVKGAADELVRQAAFPPPPPPPPLPPMALPRLLSPPRTATKLVRSASLPVQPPKPRVAPAVVIRPVAPTADHRDLRVRQLEAEVRALKLGQDDANRRLGGVEGSVSMAWAVLDWANDEPEEPLADPE